MSRLFLRDIYLGNLTEEFPQGVMHYMPKEQALQALRNETGQDFGYDRQAWEKWLDENPSHLTPSIKDIEDNLLKNVIRFIRRTLGLFRKTRQSRLCE